MKKFPYIATLLFCIALTGCRTKPFMVKGLMNLCGNMNMTGDMSMSGDMKMNGDMNMAMKADNTASRLSMVHVSGHRNSSQRIALVDVDGLLVNRNAGGFVSMGENPVALFREKLNVIRRDPSVAAIVLRVNSPGGGVTAADMMAHELKSLKADRNLPVVTCAMEVNAGGAYYLSSHSDVIVAHPTSVVGGIGVLLNLYDAQDGMGNAGTALRRIKSGEMIDIASADRIIEEEEVELLQGIADNFHERFVDLVKDSRPEATDDKLFDGRILTGSQAVEEGLVDQVGYVDDAIEVARKLAGLSPECSVMMLRRDNDRAHTALDISPNEISSPGLLSIKIPGLDRSDLPKFLYLWQPEPSLGSAL